jgi:hypothetical protein
VVTIVCLLALISTDARAILPVEDYTSIVHQIASYALQAKQYLEQVQQTIDQNTIVFKEIQQVENELLQLERMGDPRAFGLNMPGVANIQLLLQMYQQAQKDVADIAAFANPASAKFTVETILSQYGITSFKDWTSPMGVKIGAVTNLIQFNQSAYNVAVTTQQKIQTLTQQKQSLTQQRDTAISQLASAGDQSQIMKQQALITSLNSAIAQVDAQIQQTMSAALLQQQQINAANGLSVQNNSLQAQQAFQMAQEAGLNATGGTINGLSSEFGAVDDPNPATNPLGINGGGDPGLTSGNWFTGSSGANVGSTSSTGIALPTSTMIAEFGSAAAAMNQQVVVTNDATGQSVNTTIVDTGPGSKAVANGVVADLTFGTARQLGIPVNSSAPISVSFPSKVQN